MMFTVFRRALLVFAAVAFVGVGVAGETVGAFTKLNELQYRQVGVLTGSMNGAAAEAAIPHVWVVNFPDPERMMRALREGGVSAVISDTPSVELMVAEDSTLAMIKEKLRDDDYALAVRLDDDKLAGKVDAAIKGFREDGTLDKLKAKWTDGPAEGKKLDALAATGGDTLRYGVAVMGAPFVYRGDDDKLLGFDIELGALIAKKLGMKLEIEEMLFADLIPALTDKKVDMIGACITVTPERRELVRFGEPYYRGGASAMVLAK